MSQALDTVPALELTPQARAHLVEELRGSHALSSPLFQRRDQRAWAQQYLHGLRLDLPRTSVEPMGLALHGGDATAVRARPWFSSDGAWAEAALLQRHGQAGEQTWGDAEGVLTLEGSDVLQQGQEAVGVTRQDGGDGGPGAHCQAGVFLGYASRQGSTLLDRPRYLPQEWGAGAAYAARRQRCGVPPASPCTTTPPLGWELSHAVPQASPLRCRGVTGG